MAGELVGADACPAARYGEPMIAVNPVALDTVRPHDFARRGLRFWICDHCFAPRSLHPRTEWARARPLGENYYLSSSAPHFKEGW